MPLEVRKNNNASREASLQKRHCCGTYFAEFLFHELGSIGAGTERTFRTSTTGVLVLVAWGRHLRHRPFREGGQKDVLVQPHILYF